MAMNIEQVSFQIRSMNMFVYYYVVKLVVIFAAHPMLSSRPDVELAKQCLHCRIQHCTTTYYIEKCTNSSFGALILTLVSSLRLALHSIYQLPTPPSSSLYFAVCLTTSLFSTFTVMDSSHIRQDCLARTLVGSRLSKNIAGNFSTKVACVIISLSLQES